MKKLLVLLIALVPITLWAHGNHDRHAMWQKMIQRTPMAAGVAFDGKGVLWQAQVKDGYLWVSQSQDFGHSFSPAVAVNSTPEIIAANGENRPQIAFADSTILVAWAQSLTDVPFSGHVRFSSSQDGGKTWNKPDNINDDNSPVSHSFVTLLSDGKQVQAVWLDSRERVKNPSFKGTSVFTASFDAKQGQFSTNKKLAEHSCECCQIALSQDSQGNVYAFWRHVFADNIRDHALVNLNGQEQAQRITFNNWQIEACPHHGPGISIDRDNTKHLVWFNQDAKEKHVLFYGQIAAGKKELNQQIGIGNTNNQTTYPAVISTAKRLVLAWAEFDGERTQVMSMESSDFGKTFSPAKALLSSEDDHARPILLRFNERVFVAWNSPTAGLTIQEVR